LERGTIFQLKKGTKVAFEAFFDQNLFKIPEISHSAKITYDFWYKALRHLAPSTMDTSLQFQSDAKTPTRCVKHICTSRIESKMTGLPRIFLLKNDWKELDLVHSNLCGPFPVPSYGNSIYYISLIDDATRVSWVRFMTNTSETTKIIKDFVTDMELQNHKTLAAFRTDNGREYVSKNLKGFFESKGIIPEVSPPDSPGSNGVAEGLNCTIGESL